MRAAFYCAALGTTALTGLTAAPQPARADCGPLVAVPNFLLDNNNNTTAVALDTDCAGVAAANTLFIPNTTNLSVGGASPISSAGLQWTITNNGSVQNAGAQDGIQLNGGNGSVTNAGTIRGNNGVNFGAAGVSTVDNQAGGLIVGVNANAINFQGGTNATVTNNGTINGSAFGAGVNMQSADGTIDNFSMITGTGTGINMINGTVNNAAGATITTPGVAIQFGSGRIVNMGTIASTVAGTAIAAGGNTILEMHTGATLTGIAAMTSGNDLLRLAGTTQDNFDLSNIGLGQQYEGFEFFQVSGGEWTFSNNTTTAFTVNGGTLKGTATFGGLAGANGGTIAPGNSIGTINVAGNVTFAPGSTYQVEINENGTSDLIAATGTATITGGTVQLLPEPGTYASPLTYTIITAGGGVTGTFDALTVGAGFAFLSPALVYNANNVQLTINQSSAFSSAALTRNQTTTANALTGVTATATGNLLTALNNLTIQTAPQARASFESLNGEIHVAGASAALLDLNHVADTMRSGGGAFRRGGVQFASAEAPRIRLAQASLGRSMGDTADILIAASPGAAARNLEGASEENPWTYWATALGATGEVDSDSNARETEHTQAGTAFGGEYRLTDATSVGASAAFLVNDADLPSQEMDRKAYLVSLTGRTETETGFGVEGVIGYGFQQIDTKRQIAVGTFAATAEADYDAHTFFASAEAYRTYQAGHLLFRPFAGATYVYTDADGFTETGAGTAGLTNDGEGYSSLVSRLGVQASTAFEAAGMPVVPSASVAWARELGDATPSSDFTFTSGGSAFETWAPARGRDSAEVGLGVAAAVSDGISAHVGYEGSFSNRDRRNAIMGGVRVVW